MVLIKQETEEGIWILPQYFSQEDRTAPRYSLHHRDGLIIIDDWWDGVARIYQPSKNFWRYIHRQKKGHGSGRLIGFQFRLVMIATAP